MNRELEILKNNLEFYEKCLFTANADNLDQVSNANLLKSCLNHQIQIEEDIFELRIKKIIETEDPYLPPLENELNHKGFYIDEVNLKNAIENFIKLKVRIIDFFFNTSNVNYTKIGYHWREGHISLEEVMNRYIDNDKKFRIKLNSIINSNLSE
ncbi:MAG: hypothetical protein KAR38_07655 [Calditrichia bacterium]|nr:hypothetical protein [Calditrichia bacterium]